MAELRDILYTVRITSTSGDMNVDVKGVAFDSRKVQTGFLFVAVKGTQSDGHAFIEKSIIAGAIAIVCETGLQVPDQAFWVWLLNSHGSQFVVYRLTFVVVSFTIDYSQFTMTIPKASAPSELPSKR